MGSKFVNEVQSQKSAEKVKVKRMGDLAVSLRQNGLSDDDCTRFMDWLFAQKYDSETIIDDLVDETSDPFNLYPQSNLFPMIGRNLFLAKMIKKHVGAERNDDDKLPLFGFGRDRLYH